MSSIQYPEQIDYRRADLQKSYQDALDEAIEANPGVSLHNLPATDDMKFIRGQMDELDEVEKSLFGKKYLDTGSTVAQDIASLLDPDTFANRQAESKKSYQDSIDEAFEKTSGGGIQEIPATDDTRRYSEYDPSITEPYKAELEQAKEEYEAAYSQYQIAEENYYTVPDGDFQKAQDDYLAADTRLAEAEERVKQAEQDLQAQEDMATYTKYQEMIASLPENDRMAILHSGGRDFSMAYGYLLQKGYSREDINAMYETMKRGMNAQVSKRVIDSVYDYAGQNVGTGAVGFTGARVGNVLGGVTGTLQTIHDTAQHYFQGSPYHGTDPNGLGYLPSRSASAADQSISDAIEGEDGGIIRKGAAFVYRGAANAADNLTRMAIASATGGGSLAGAGINSALSFTQGFQGSYREAQEKGGSPIQGLLVGAVDGGMEVFTESRTFERWMNLKDPELIGQGVYAWLKSAAVGIGNEIAEEEASYIANTIADAVVMADKGESAEFIKSAVAAGKTPAEARWELVKKYAHEMAVTAADTAMSTLLMDGATGVVANHQYKRTYGGSAAELVQEGLESLEGTQSRMLAEQYQQKLDSGKSLSGYELRRLVNANEGQFAREESEAAENNPEVEDTIQEDYRDIPMQNEQEDYRYVPEQVEQEDYRYVPTQTERESKNEKGFTVGTDSEHGTTVISFEDVPPKSVQAALKENGFKFSSKDKVWFGQQSQEDARRIVLEAGGELYRKSEQFDEAAPEPHDVNAEAAPDGTISSDQTADNNQDVISKPFRASDTYGTTLLNLSDGSTVETEITGIASNEPGKLMLNVTGQDSPVQASDISYADSGEASLYYYVNEMELMPDAANMIVEQAKKAVAGLDGTVRAEKMAQFSQSIYGMYSLGKIGVPQGKAMSSQFAGQLSENMAEVGYQLGRRIYQQNVQQKEASKQQRAVSQRARAATGGKKINGVQYDGLTVRQGKDGGVEIEGVTLNEQQKAGIQAAELLASIGMNVHVFQSQIGADGKPVGENGSYSMADGSIHIDLNAGNDGQGVMAYTIAHELTHFMEDQQPEQFRLFTDALFDALDMDMEAEIANKAEKLKRQQPKVYQNASKDKLMADARSEVIAEACETMLTDTDAAQRIAKRIQQQDASLLERIVQWFKDLSQKLRDAYNGLNPDSQIAKDAKKTIQQVDGLVHMWAEMAVDAAENYSSGESNGQMLELSDSRTAFSVREEDPPEKTGIAYKVFFAKDGKLYPPMVANPGGTDTPIGVWLNADVGAAAPPSKTGRMQVKAGGKGTQGGSGSLAFRPGWHLGDIPRANQFARLNPETGVKDLFPSNFVWAECEYAMDVDYQDEAMSYGYTKNGKFRHSYAGLPRLPVNGYYRYRTNPNPDTVPWVITGAMKVNRILDDEEVAEICRKNGVEPMQRQGGDIDLEKLGFNDTRKKYSVRDNAGESENSEYSSLSESDINAIQNIGRKSVNEFSSSDIKATERFARKYWQEMGIKSPFFRAWFGDWRANDKTALEIADKAGNTRGVQHNDDTGWDINVSGQVFHETKAHRSTANREAVPYLRYINDLVRKSVLLDSFGVGQEKAKSGNSLLMHSMYAVADIGNGPEVIKLYVEEMNDPNSKDTRKRTYQLQNIEKAFSASVRVQGISPSSLTNTSNAVHTVADLFEAVKRMDKNFKPNSASKVVNDDGAPKVVYHGTNKEFWEFDLTRTGSNYGETSEGLFFFTNKKSGYQDSAADYAAYAAKKDGKERIVEVYLDIKKPLKMDSKGYFTPTEYFDKNAEEIYDKYLEGDYDGIIIENSDKSNDDSAIYLVDNPVQIKSASDNIGTFDTENQDIRFSTRETADQRISRENNRLKEDVSNLKELLRLQGTVTGGKMFKPESIRAAANFIMRETGRILDDSQKVQLEDMLRETYGVLSDENVTYDNIVEECTKVAQWLDENGKTEDALDEYASGILSEMKGTPIQLDETQKQEARSLFGSLSEFRSRIAGTYKLSADGIPLDDIWNGLAIEYPMYFDADASSSGLPGLLVEAIDRLRNTRNTDPYQHMDVDQMMVKVYDGFWKAKKLTTVADRYQKKIDALNQKHEEAMQKISKLKSDQKAAKLSHQQELRETRQRMKQEASEEIAHITKKYQDQRSASVENRNRTKVRNQIFGLAEKFQKMATAPAKANTAHAPVGLVHSVARFCEIFADSEARAVEYAANRLSAKETEMELMNDLRGPTKTRLKEADAINRQRERLFKQAKAIAEIQERYRRIKDDSALSMFYDPHVETLVSQLQEQLRDRDIYDMTAKELNSVYDTMNAMMYTITNANRVFSMEKDKTLVGVVKKLGDEISENKVSHGVIIDAARKYNMWQMSPDTFFNFICGFKKDNDGIAVQKMFSDGSERMLGVQREFYRMFRNITEAQDSGKKKYFNQMMKHPMKEMVDWGLTDSAGNPVKTPRDMMLQAYMLLNQEDSFKSIVFGGFKLPDQGRYYKGKIDSAYSSADERALLSSGINGEYGDLLHEIRLRQEQIDSGGLEVETVEQLNREIIALQDQAIDLVEGATARTIKLRDSIEKLLTDYDREAIDTAKKWYKYTGQLMTDVYMQMYGYKPNLVEDYVPIHRDLSTVKTDIRVGEEGNAFNLENSGFTKDRVNSRAPILLTGFFNELGSQQQRISRYYGFAQVQKDFNRIWNMKVPGSQYTIKGKIAAKYGAGKTILGVSGEQYIEHYIQNVAGVRGGDDILSVLYGNAASATLSLNPRVALSQAASVPTAAAVVGWKSMAKGFGKGLSTSFSKNKRNQLADDSVWFFQRYRGAGGITEIADMKAKGGLWSRAANSKYGKYLFNWCQYMDVFSTASMWAMAEDYVQSNGMKTTDGAYKAAVEQCYADIIRKSQPNYTVTERSDLLRDSRGGMKLLTMYKTQSNQNFNILLNAIGEYRAAVLANNSEKSAQSATDLKNAKKNLANGITSVTIGGTLSFVLLRALVNFAWAKVKPYKDDDTDELEADDFFLALAKEVGSSFAGMFALGGQLYDFVYSCISGDKYYGISDSAISTISSIFESTSNLIQKATDENKNLSWNDVNKVFSSTLTGLGFPYKNASSFVDAAKQWYRNLETGTFFQYSDDTTTRQYRGRILKAWNNGDMEKIDDTLAILASKSSKDTDEAVNKDVTHGFANDFLKDQVKKGNIDAYEAVKLLRYIGHDDPDGVVAKWKFQDENPNVENPSSSLVSAYNNRGDIPGDVVIAAYKFKNNSNKEETVKYIQGLKLTAAQKKRLWNLIKGTWKDKDTPWA